MSIREIQTLQNRAKAMNEVNKAILSTVEICQHIIANQSYSETYKADGSLNKKTLALLNDEVKHARGRLHRVIYDDSFNSVSIEFHQIYKLSNGSSNYYKETVYIICKGQDTNTDRARYNVPTPLGLDKYRARWTCKKLVNMWEKRLKLQAQSTKIKSEISSLDYYLFD